MNPILIVIVVLGLAVVGLISILILRRSTEHPPTSRSYSPHEKSSLNTRQIADLEPELRKLLAQKRKIEAIKLVREHTKWGLKESKDYVDQLDR